MEIITGYVGKKHVTSEQERDVNQGIVGPGSYVLKTGMQMEAEVSSNNEIKIRDGVLMHQGCAASIKKNTYDSLTIINGSQGMKRIDLIVARYEKNRDDETESLNLEVIQGTPAESNPAVPEYTEGSIQAGDYIADMPMYQVIINGLNITEVKRLFEVEPDIDTLKKELAELNGNKPSFFHHELLWSGKLASKKTATGMSPNWSKYTLFVCRFDGGVSMALGIRCKDDSSSGWKDWIRFIGGNDSGSATDVYVASVMISGDTITSAGVGSHALTSTGCPGVDRIMCEIYGII